MKKNTKKNLSLFIFFFIVGSLWGKFFYYNKQNRDALFQRHTLKILAESGFLPDDITESYSLENNVLIEVTAYKSQEELVKELSTNKYDLIAFKSFYANNVINNLSKISYKEIKNKELISADFKNPPYDHENTFTIPLFWGVQKNASVEKTLLWIESIGVTKDSKYKKEAHNFVDYILQTDVAIEAVRYKKVASTNKALERIKNIESKLKPSYLRKISIRDLAFADKASF